MAALVSEVVPSVPRTQTACLEAKLRQRTQQNEK